MESLQQPHTVHLPVAKGGDEVKAAVYTVVLDVLAVQATLVPEVLLKLLVDVVGDRLPAEAETRQGVQAFEATTCSCRLYELTMDSFRNSQLLFC